MKQTRQTIDQSESGFARGVVIQVPLPNGDPYQFNLHDVAWIDLEDLHGEVAGQAQRYAFYANLHVGVKDSLRQAGRELAQFLVDSDEAVRSDLGPKATETNIKNTIKAKPGYRAIEVRVEKLESLELRLAAVREALTQRRDMLQSACMLRAPEGGGDPDKRARSRYQLK